MGIAKKLAVGFSVVAGVPAAAAVLYLNFAHSTIHECRMNPKSEQDKTGALVVRWNLPPLIGERSGRYGLAIKNRSGDIVYAKDSDDKGAYIKQADVFCTKRILEID